MKKLSSFQQHRERRLITSLEKSRDFHFVSLFCTRDWSTRPLEIDSWSSACSACWSSGCNRQLVRIRSIYCRPKLANIHLKSVSHLSDRLSDGMSTRSSCPRAAIICWYWPRSEFSVNKISWHIPYTTIDRYQCVSRTYAWNARCSIQIAAGTIRYWKNAFAA